MTPVDTKSIFAMLCITMGKLDDGSTDVATAIAMSKLVGQANNILTYELKRAVLLSNPDFAEHHRSLEYNNIEISE